MRPLVHDGADSADGRHAHTMPLVCGQGQHRRDKVLGGRLQPQAQGVCEWCSKIVESVDMLSLYAPQGEREGGQPRGECRERCTC